VRVRLIDGDLIRSMGQMRIWLDHQRIEPHAFRHASGSAGITCIVEFNGAAEAAAFAQEFGGRPIDASTPGPGHAAPSPPSPADGYAEGR
jgi:hypothetical protein